MSSKNEQLVVGFDDSTQSELAVKWAVMVAKRRHAPITVVHATGVERPSVELARLGLSDVYLHRAQEIADRGAERARELGANEVQATGVHGGAAGVLVNLSREAALVVVGHRGRGKLHDRFVGSSALAVATHSACPVAVIRDSVRPLPSMDWPIIVGVDGSVSGRHALDEAAWLANDTESFLRVVTAWTKPDNSLWSGLFNNLDKDVAPSAPEPAGIPQKGLMGLPWGEGKSEADVYDTVCADLRARAEEVAASAVKRVHERYPDLKVEPIVVEEDAPKAILEAASDASIIVVGARGSGDLRSVLLGSVSRKIMRGAECAVYIIR